MYWLIKFVNLADFDGAALMHAGTNPMNDILNACAHAAKCRRDHPDTRGVGLFGDTT
jgi:hypothetical protein